MRTSDCCICVLLIAVVYPPLYIFPNLALTHVLVKPTSLSRYVSGCAYAREYVSCVQRAYDVGVGAVWVDAVRCVRIVCVSNV